MPDTARTIIVSGGIESVAPFTVGFIPMVVNTTPDVISDSIMFQVTGPPTFLVIGAAPSDATTEILQTTGAIYPSGGLTDSLAIGRGASVVGAVGGQLAIGYGITIDALGNAANFNNLLIGGANTADDAGLTGMANNVIVGFSHTLSDQASNNVVIGNALAVTLQNSNCVIIGNGNTRTGASIGSLVSIGNGTNVGSRGVAIGDRANASGGDCIAIGPQAPRATGAQSIAIGRGAVATALDGVCIGSFASNFAASDQSSIAIGINSQTFAANQLVIGGISLGQINEVVIGAGNTPNMFPIFANLTIRTTNLGSFVGSDLPGASITIKTGTGLGNALGGQFIVEVPVIQASGNTVQTVVTGLEVSESVTALDTFLRIFDVDNAVLERVSVGAAGSGGVGFKVLRIPN